MACFLLYIFSSLLKNFWKETWSKAVAFLIPIIALNTFSSSNNRPSEVKQCCCHHEEARENAAGAWTQCWASYNLKSCHVSTLHQEKPKHKIGRGEKGHKPSGVCNEHVSCATPARDTKGAQERYRDVQAHQESSQLDLKITEGNLLIKTTLNEKMSHSVRTGCSQTVSLSALIVARETKLWETEQTEPPQSFTISLWTARECDRWRLNQWQGQVLLSMGEETEPELPVLKLAVEKEGLLSFARAIPWLHSAGRSGL